MTTASTKSILDTQALGEGSKWKGVCRFHSKNDGGTRLEGKVCACWLPCHGNVEECMHVLHVWLVRGIQQHMTKEAHMAEAAELEQEFQILAKRP